MVGNPAGIACITAGIRLATYIFAKEVDDHVMESNAAVGVAFDNVKGIYRVFGSYDNAGLFPDLSLGSLLQGFSQPNTTAGNCP